MTSSRPSYDMYTTSGDAAVERMVVRIGRRASCGKLRRPDLEAAVDAAVATIARTHDEVNDTEPRYAIDKEISRRVCVVNMWAPLDRS